jgi:hypothetical protein
MKAPPIPPIFSVALLSFVSILPGSAETLDYRTVETYGMSGFRTQWDAVIPLSPEGAHVFTDDVVKDRSPSAIWDEEGRQGQPGKLGFDALQRSLLVRFPGVAEAIAEKINAGMQIEKLELHLPFQDTELWPQHGRDFWDPKSGGYTGRRNWGVDELYRKEDPTWHAIAYALRRPWSGENPQTGPTFNAFIKGAGYWGKYGAQDEQKDRFPGRFGPTEVSTRQKAGVMDITALVQDLEFGATLGERLRVLSDNGLLINKWETYDHRFFRGVYEWATATGGRAILIDQPFLSVTFAPAATAETVALPPAANIAELAQQLATTGQGGSPTAVMPSREEILQFNEELKARPAWMSENQHARVMELFGRARLEQDREPLENPMFFDDLLDQHVIYRLTAVAERPDGGGVVMMPGDEEVRFAAWVDSILAKQPRGWEGFNASREMIQWFRFGHTLPGPARDAIQAYWTAWLMPDRETHLPVRTQDLTTEKLIHPMMDQLNKGGGTSSAVPDSYWLATGDWRGNKSFYRSGFCYDMSTQNFNMTSSAGALLGGSIINSDLAMKDGRRGVRSFPLGWAWNDGSSQEHIDHYYFSLTLSGAKALADFSHKEADRLLGQSILAASMEELAGSWHPGLRRFIAPSSRTHLNHLLATQEGIDAVVHVLSEDGVLLDLTKEQFSEPNVRLVGREVAPHTIANQSMSGPWVPSWLEPMVDAKKLPFLARHISGGRLRTAYLGKHYGLASTDQGTPRIKMMGQWRRDDQPVDQVQQLTTMLIMAGVNNTNFVDSAHGVISYVGSAPSVQHQNKMLVVTSPYAPWTSENGDVGLQGDGKASQIKSYQTSIALYNTTQPRPPWTVHVFNPSAPSAGWTEVTELPFETRQGNIIAIHDGVSYFAAVPLESTDLGRQNEVILREGDTQTYERMEHTAALVIDNFNMQVAEPLTAGTTDANAIDAAHGGFYVELADVSEFPTFADFQNHLAALKVNSVWDEAKNRITVTVVSGGDTLEMSRDTIAKNEAEALSNEELTATINGEPNRLPEGILRDTDYAVISASGRMEKGGARLLTENRSRARLIADPERGVFETWSPYAMNGVYALELPGGMAVKADGRVPLMRLAAFPGENKYVVNYAWANEGGPQGAGDARALYFTGMQAKPEITVNGEAADLIATTLDGKPCYALALGGELLPPAELTSRLRLIDSAQKFESWPNPDHHAFRSWFYLTGLAGGPEKFEEKMGPELEMDGNPLSMDSSFQNEVGEGVEWKRFHVARGVGGPRPLEGIGRKEGESNATFSKPDERPATFFFYSEVEADANKEANVILKNLPDHVLARVYVGNDSVELKGGWNRSAPVKFKKGINPVLLKLTQTDDQVFGMRFQLGGPLFGFPVVEGLYYITEEGRIPVTPGPDDKQVTWRDLQNGIMLAVPVEEN